MVRTICCMAVLLAGGAALAAPPTPIDEAPQKPRLRFLSLAEARAIALEQASLDDFHPTRPGAGLDSQIDERQPATLKGSHAHYRVLTGRTPQQEHIIRITGVRRDGRRAELERTINQVLLNVETAYWNLYGSYWQLHSREQALRFAYETWKIVGARYGNGQANRAAVAQTEGQYNLFRSQRINELDTVLENERQLRAIMGMTIEDGRRLVPCDSPSIGEKELDWDTARVQMSAHRPELRIARHDVEKASARQAEQELVRAQQVLHDQALKAERFLGLYHRRVASSFAQIKAARAQHEAFVEQRRLRSDAYRDDKKDASLDLLLESQRFEADALATEYQSIVTYNNSLAGWEYAKGAILAYAHVALSTKTPPEGTKTRAVVYERRRTREQMRDEANEQTHSLVSLWKGRPPLPGVEADVRLIGWTVSEVLPPQTKKAKRMP